MMLCGSSALDRSHQIHRFAVLDGERLSLCMPIPCSPVHVPPMAIARRLIRCASASAFAFARFFGIECDAQVEVAVADVADDRRDQPGRIGIRLGFEQAISQSRDRYTQASVAKTTFPDSTP
jgi:hypothetical protein